MSDKKLEVGKVYKIDHCRKGRFTCKIESVGDVWATGLITEGETRALCEYNVKETGEEVTFRISFATFQEVV